MPIEKLHPTAELMEALCERYQATGERITLAWTMISGVNTSEEDAKQLAELTKGIPVMLDLIDVNDPESRTTVPVVFSPSTDLPETESKRDACSTVKFIPPSPEELSAFRDALRLHLAAPVARRYSGGKDIGTACGLLAGAE